CPRPADPRVAGRRGVAPIGYFAPLRVVPAKAGTHPSAAASAEPWVPAPARMTMKQVRNGDVPTPLRRCPTRTARAERKGEAMSAPDRYQWRRDKDGLGVWEHRGKVAVAGVGHSPVDRRWDEVSMDKTLGAYSILACRKAMDEAGVTPDQID